MEVAQIGAMPRAPSGNLLDHINSVLAAHIDPQLIGHGKTSIFSRICSLQTTTNMLLPFSRPLPVATLPHLGGPIEV